MLKNCFNTRGNVWTDGDKYSPIFASKSNFFPLFQLYNLIKVVSAVFDGQKQTIKMNAATKSCTIGGKEFAKPCESTRGTLRDYWCISNMYRLVATDRFKYIKDRRHIFRYCSWTVYCLFCA